MKKTVYKLWKIFRIMSLDVISQRLWMSHQLQYIISSKDSENLKKSLHVGGEAKKSATEITAQFQKSLCKNIVHCAIDKCEHDLETLPSPLGYIKLEWDNIPKVQQLVSSQMCKDRCYIVINMAMSQLFWDALMASNLTSNVFLQMFPDFKHLISFLWCIVNTL